MASNGFRGRGGRPGGRPGGRGRGDSRGRGDFRGRGRGGGGGPRGGRGAGGRGGGRPRENAPPPGTLSKKLFIGNLPETVRVGDLRALFNKHGDITECDIVRDFAFVHYDSEQEAKAAVDNLHLQEFQGSNITVEFSYSKVRHEPGMGQKNECFGCGEIGHWSKDCPKGSTQSPNQRAPRGRREGYGGGGGGGGGRSNYNDDFTRDITLDEDEQEEKVGGHQALSYSEQFFRREARYGRDPYAMYRSRLAALSPPVSERHSSRFSPYARRVPEREPYSRESTYKDPYERPPPDYYSQKNQGGSQNPYDRSSYDPPATSSRVPPPSRFALP